MMKKLEFERPRTRSLRSHARNPADAVMVLAQVARERHRLGQERQSLVKRMKRIEERLSAITATETKLVPMIRIDKLGSVIATDTPATAACVAPPPRQAPAYAGGMTLQY
jgi:hypothetical protein